MRKGRSKHKQTKIDSFFLFKPYTFLTNMPSTTKRVTFLIPDTSRPLTPPLTPTSLTFNSTSNKLRKLQPTKRSFRYPNHISSNLKVNLDLHPLPLSSFTLLDSPTSPLSIQTVQLQRQRGDEGDERENQFDANYPTINTKINMDSLIVDFEAYDQVLSDYFSSSSNSYYSSGEETISPPLSPLKSLQSSFTPHKLQQRRPSLLSTFPLPPARFMTKEQEIKLHKVYQAEDKFLEAKRISWELSERLEETSYASLLIENELDEIRFRLMEINRD